jgi:Kef-type K+ transport system membrane component KefB
VLPSPRILLARPSLRHAVEMAPVEFRALFIVLALAFAAPVIASAVRWVRVPSVVLELVAGIVVGPGVLGWVHVDETLNVLAAIGLGYLLFVAGTEVDLEQMRGRLLRQSLLAYVLSFSMALVIGVGLHAIDLIQTPTLFAVIVSATALGVVIPVLRDAGAINTAVGQTIVVGATVAEFSAVLLLSLLFGGEGSATDKLVMIAAFAVLGGLIALVLATLRRRPGIVEAMARMADTTAQIRVRGAMLLLVLFLFLGEQFGLESILAAFVAGVLIGSLRSGGHGAPATNFFWVKVDAIGFGFLIPVFFVVSGLRFDIEAFKDDPTRLVRIPLFFAVIVLVRGVPVLLLRDRLPGRALPAAASLHATSLSFVVAATAIGVEIGKLRPENAAALVGAALLATIVLPSVALASLRDRAPDLPIPDRATDMGG